MDSPARGPTRNHGGSWATLESAFGGVVLSHPFMLPSAQPSRSREMLSRALDRGWAGCVLQTATPWPERFHQPRPSIQRVSYGGTELGIGNIDVTSQRAAISLADDIAALKSRHPDRVVVGSLTAGEDRDEWTSLASLLARHGADALEINVSTPHGLPEQGFGAAIGHDAAAVKTVTKWVAEATTVPVWVKLPPTYHLIEELTAAAKAGGAAAVTLTNTVPAVLGLDTAGRRVLPSIGGYSTIGGLAGVALTPLALACLVAAARVDGIDRVACGGVIDGETSLQHLLLGASALQVYTPVLAQGYSVVEGLLEHLAAALGAAGVRSVSEYVGTALPSLIGHNELPTTEGLLAVIDAEICTACQQCVAACEDAGYQAIQSDVSGSIPRVDAKACTACGLCEAICPAPGAITIQQIRA